jgi:hypothetical protein
MSPTIFREKGYRFYFFSREETRPHVHVHHSTGEAKFWMNPKIELAVNHGLSLRHLREAERIVKGHEDEIRRAWQIHFPQG